MQNAVKRFVFLREWYGTHVRPLLKELEPSRVVDYDGKMAALQAAEAHQNDAASLCVLGRSGVGKSTLINALVGGAQMIVPNGGIGPLTAHALRVQYGVERSLEVRYHGKLQLWNVTFGLQKSYQDELGLTAQALEPPPDLVTTEVKKKAKQIHDTDPSAATPEDELLRKEARTENLRQAALIISGDQNANPDPRYLVSGLRAALSMTPLPSSSVTISSEDLDRINAVRRALEMAKLGTPLKLLESSDPRAFRDALLAHAAGHLSPLVAEMIVRVPHSILSSGLEIVDLPGVGMASDVYRKKTREWIRSKAQAVLLVVDHRGLDVAVLEMLRQTEFLNRLLYSRDDPEGRPELLVAVTQIDTIAETYYQTEMATPKRRKRDYFQTACEQARDLVRNQLRDQLGNPQIVQNHEPGGASSLQARDALSILGEIETFAISAVQYRKLLTCDPDDHSFLATEEETNVPALSLAIATFALRFREHRQKNFAQAVEQLFSRIMATLTLLNERWGADRREHAEMDQLRVDLKAFLEPLVADFHRRQGRFAGFIREEIPSRIDILVDKATMESGREIEKYLRDHVQDTHWATLRAAVKHRGTFHGTSRGVDLPREFALRFEEPIASTWGNQLLNPIRQKTKDYADDCVLLVEQIAKWAGEQGARVKPDLVNAQATSIRQDANQLTTLGAAAVKLLREEVKNKLIDCIEQPIRMRCEKFVSAGGHLGPGTKFRILNLFGLLAREIVEVSKPAAKQIMLDLYKQVCKEIFDALESHANPIEQASESIVESQEAYLHRSDAQRKRRILASIDAAINASGVKFQAGSRRALQLPGPPQ